MNQAEDHQQIKRLQSEIKELKAKLNRLNEVEGKEHFVFELFNKLPFYLFLKKEDCGIYFANDKFEELFGNFKGKKCYELMQESKKPCKDCEALQVFEDRKTRIRKWTDRKNRSYHSISDVYVDRNGTDYIIEIGFDISHIEKKEEEVLSREKHYRSLFENSTIGMYRTTPQGEILMVNPQAIRLLGYKSFEELAQRNLEKEGFEPDYPRQQFIKELFERGKITGLESAWKTREGTTLYVRESAVVVKDRQGAVKYFEGTFEDITDRKKAEISLKESKEQLDHVLSGSNDGFFDLIVQSREIIVSSRYQEILGFEKPRKNIKLSWKEYYEFIHPDDLQSLLDFTRQILGSKQRDHFEFQFRIISRRSEVKCLQIKAKAVGFNADGNISRIAGTVTDITEKVNLQKNLRESEQRYKALFEFSPIALWEEDYSAVAREIGKLKRSGLSDIRKYLKEHPGFVRETAEKVRVLNVNNTAVAMYNARSKEHLMESYYEVFQDPKRTFVVGIMETIYHGGYSYSRENDCNTFDGMKMTVQARWSVAPGFEKDYSRIYIADSDISEIKKTEAALKKAKRRAEESDKLKSAFLANMSHEIRTPMNSIIGFSEILEEADSFGDEEKKKFLSIIQQNGKQLLGLINDIIDISKIEAGQLSFSMSHFDVNAVLNELLLIFRSQVKSDEDKKICIHFLPALDTGLMLHSDPVRFKQIFTNLLSNALKFTEEGKIEFGYFQRNAKIRFFVKDTGIGIPVSKQKLIFERFGQADPIGKANQGGTGLGLAITKNLVEIMGGRIWVESSPGAGSAFYFDLPYSGEIKKGTKHSASKSAATPKKLPEWRGRSILVVEDDGPSFEVVSTFLEPTEINIEHAFDGVEAVQKYKRGAFDLVLMDLSLPEMDGISAMENILKINPGCKLIAYTAYAMEQSRESCLEKGFVDFIPKPIKRKEFYRVIGQAID